MLAALIKINDIPVRFFDLFVDMSQDACSFFYVSFFVSLFCSYEIESCLLMLIISYRMLKNKVN